MFSDFIAYAVPQPPPLLRAGPMQPVALLRPPLDLARLVAVGAPAHPPPPDQLQQPPPQPQRLRLRPRPLEPRQEGIQRVPGPAKAQLVRAPPDPRRHV